MARLLRTTHLLAIAVAVTLGVGLAPRAAEAQDDLSRAKAHYQKGSELFAGGDYRGAIKHFGAADRIAPSPLLDYNIGLAHEQLGENAEALRRFRSYRSRAPNAANGAEVDGKIAKLESAAALPALAPAPAPSPGVDPAPVPPANPVPSAVAPTYQPTGDAALDRAAAVNLGDVAAKHPTLAAAASAPEAGGGEPGAPPVGGAVAEPVDKPKRKSKPLYKRWWFWVVVGVSALILIDIASNPDSNSRVMPTGALDPSIGAPAATPGGFTLRF